jgi:hypothetical protein
MFYATGVTESIEGCSSAVLDDHRGKFAVFSGQRLLGVHNSLDLAMQSVAAAFDGGILEDGTTLLINEIGEAPRLRFIAEKTLSAE